MITNVISADASVKNYILRHVRIVLYFYRGKIGEKIEYEENNDPDRSNKFSLCIWSMPVY